MVKKESGEMGRKSYQRQEVRVGEGRRKQGDKWIGIRD